MKITKYIHSCLLIKDHGKTILIDPGNFSFNEKALDITSLESLEYVLITHEHHDHMSLPYIKELVTKFPEVKIVSNSSVVNLLGLEGIKATVETPDGVVSEEASHERVFGVTVPKNNVFTIFNKLTHPGDSLQIKKTAEILALPIQAPWCSLTQSVECALSLKPRYIIPIHDWHWNEKARDAFYQRLENYFKENNITFLPLKTGVEFEVETSN